jgi:hypothetical protein
MRMAKGINDSGYRKKKGKAMDGEREEPIYKNDIISAIIIKERSDPRKAEGCV